MSVLENSGKCSPNLCPFPLTIYDNSLSESSALICSTNSRIALSPAAMRLAILPSVFIKTAVGVHCAPKSSAVSRSFCNRICFKDSPANLSRFSFALPLLIKTKFNFPFSSFCHASISGRSAAQGLQFGLTNNNNIGFACAKRCSNSTILPFISGNAKSGAAAPIGNPSVGFARFSRSTSLPPSCEISSKTSMRRIICVCCSEIFFK